MSLRGWHQVKSHLQGASLQLQGWRVQTCINTKRHIRYACQAEPRPSAAHDLSFPHDHLMDVDGQKLTASEIITMLEPFLTPERVERISKVASQRSYGVVPVLESTYNMGNLAAVCRTADAFGMGAVHYIKRRDEKFKQSSRTSAGADKWLDVRVWDSTEEAVGALKAAGFQLVVTHLSRSSVTIQEVDFTRPTALVFGSEKFGASDEIVAAADHCAIIPMAGMVESLNISVAAACCLYEAQQQRTRKGMTGDLTDEQQLALKAALMMRSVRQSSTLITELLQRPPPSWQSGRVKAEAAAERAARAALAA